MARRNQGPKLRWFAERDAYYITWTVNGRSRKRSTGTASCEEAQIIYAEWLHRHTRCDGPSDPAEALVTDILADYINERGPKVVGQETMARAVETLARLWEARTVAEVPVDAYVKRRNRSAGTTRRELGVLKAAINHAHKRGRITRSVTVELPPCPPSRSRWLTREEAGKLLRASLKDRKSRLYLPLFIVIGIYTGRRKEAVLSLRWPQIDFKANRINCEIEGRAVTKKRRGQIPIPAPLLPHLIRARRRGTDMGYVLHINGKPIQNMKKGFAAACKRAGLEGVTPHTLRHTAATWIMQGGVPAWQAAAFLSMSEATLTRVYGHHHPDYMREAAEAIGNRRRGTGA